MNAIAIAEGLPSISVTDVSVTCVNMGNFVFGIFVVSPNYFISILVWRSVDEMKTRMVTNW